MRALKVEGEEIKVWKGESFTINKILEIDNQLELGIFS